MFFCVEASTDKNNRKLLKRGFDDFEFHSVTLSEIRVEWTTGVKISSTNNGVVFKERFFFLYTIIVNPKRRAGLVQES